VNFSTWLANGFEDKCSLDVSVIVEVSNRTFEKLSSKSPKVNCYRVLAILNVFFRLVSSS
jgi:hypothetical protein